MLRGDEPHLIVGLRCGAHAAMGQADAAAQTATAAEGSSRTQQGQGAWNWGGI